MVGSPLKDVILLLPFLFCFPRFRSFPMKLDQSALRLTKVLSSVACRFFLDPPESQYRFCARSFGRSVGHVPVIHRFRSGCWANGIEVRSLDKVEKWMDQPIDSAFSGTDYQLSEPSPYVRQVIEWRGLGLIRSTVYQGIC